MSTVLNIEMKNMIRQYKQDEAIRWLCMKSTCLDALPC